MAIFHSPFFFFLPPSSLWSGTAVPCTMAEIALYSPFTMSTPQYHCSARMNAWPTTMNQRSNRRWGSLHDHASFICFSLRAKPLEALEVIRNL